MIVRSLKNYQQGVNKVCFLLFLLVGKYLWTSLKLSYVLNMKWKENFKKAIKLSVEVYHSTLL